MESPMTAADASPQPNQNDPDAAPASVMPFPVSPDSPFTDGYDIAAERDALADLVAAGYCVEDDPRWARFVELRERENELREAARTEKPNVTSAAAVVAREDSPVAKLGQLADATPDTMTLHTKDAYRMFTGRLADAAAKLPHIPGGRRFAAILKSIWHLSANDNPYADWILVRMYEGLVSIRNHLDRVIKSREEAFDLLKRKGLTLSVMGSRSPKTVELGFRSPYGYATAEAIVEFDYYVRIVKTLIHKDRISDAEGRTAIRQVGREMRALFIEPIRWEKHLLREELRALSRSDFLPGADEAARQRVRAAITLFGGVPREVFTGAVAPRHTRRRVKLTDAELRLLEQASLKTGEDAPQPDTELM